MNNIIEDLKEVMIKMEEGKESREEVYSLFMRCLAELTIIKSKQAADSWANNPDRMGGQFTDEEINRRNEWT
jgi:hypothetical protein